MIELDEATTAAWIRIYDRVSIAEMPPRDAAQPTDRHRETFVRLLGEPLTETHAASKGTILRRLSRREYQNTMNDLFGTHLDPAAMPRARNSLNACAAFRRAVV